MTEFETMVLELSKVIAERNEQRAAAEKANAQADELDLVIADYQERMTA